MPIIHEHAIGAYIAYFAKICKLIFSRLQWHYHVCRNMQTFAMHVNATFQPTFQQIPRILCKFSIKRKRIF